ncbi:MAG: metallophosphoesterase [Promethearchaeia archaeon]
MNLKIGEYPIIIKPNLGQPTLLNLKDYINENYKIIKKVTFKVIIIALPKHSEEEILEYFYPNLFIQPILKDDGPFKARRGEKFILKPVEIRKLKKLREKEYLYFSDEECFIFDLYNSSLKIENIFGKRTTLYEITFEIENIIKILKLLLKNERDFYLFDIIHDLPNRFENKINYHSLAIYNKDWSNFRFIHATDFHIARRNDFIIKFMREKVKNQIKIYKNNKKKFSKVDTSILYRDFEFKSEFQEEKLNEIKYGRLNFNYALRKLIEFINNEVKDGKLDFVLMSGDLIDYIEIARGNYQYRNNFFVFIDILLGINRGLDLYPYLTEREFLNKQEILAPIFTTVGNHDYRRGHYSVRLGKIKKIFGFRRKDISFYNDIKFFNYFNALYSRERFLEDYFRHINPNLNYKLKIGENFTFIFLDTGEDSIADMHDLLKGSPSTKGITDFQINLLRSYINNAFDDKIIIVMHTPPVSPSLSRFQRLRFKRKFKLKRKLRWSDFYEFNLKKYYGTGRLEKILNMKYQTIMYNWATFLKICVGMDKYIRRKVDLILCGHTHTIKEFRLKEARTADTINLGFYFAPIIINNPCEIYANNYRAIFKSFRDLEELKIWYDVNKPFIFQTQAIGPLALGYKLVPPGFRYLEVKNQQFAMVDIYYLLLKQKKLNL